MIIEEDNGPKLYVKESGIHGYGVFAKNIIYRDEVVIDYSNSPSKYKIRWDKLTPHQRKYNWYYPINPSECYTSDKISKFTYINHSRNPNCQYLWIYGLIIVKYNIQKDDEVTIDYREEWHPDRSIIAPPDWI